MFPNVQNHDSGTLPCPRTAMEKAHVNDRSAEPSENGDSIPAGKAARERHGIGSMLALISISVRRVAARLEYY